jgi:hypothetical protein
MFSAGQRADQTLRVVNQHRKMLRANPEIVAAILEMNEWGLGVAPVARETGSRALRHGYPIS